MRATSRAMTRRSSAFWRSSRSSRIKADSVESLFRQWYEACCKKNKKRDHDILRSFELHVFPAIGKLPAEQVSLHEWLNLLEKHAAARPGIAERILINAKQMLKWAVLRAP